MKKLAETIWFVALSLALYFLLAAAVVGYSCFRHGDVGPYPETDWLPWLLPLAMLAAFVLRSK